MFSLKRGFRQKLSGIRMQWPNLLTKLKLNIGTKYSEWILKTFSLKHCVTNRGICCYKKVLLSFKLVTKHQISESWEGLFSVIFTFFSYEPKHIHQFK